MGKLGGVVVVVVVVVVGGGAVGGGVAGGEVAGEAFFAAFLELLSIGGEGVSVKIDKARECDSGGSMNEKCEVRANRPSKSNGFLSFDVMVPYLT